MEIAADTEWVPETLETEISGLEPSTSSSSVAHSKASETRSSASSSSSPGALPLQFINLVNEENLRKPKNAALRKAVRSHVRRDSHFRQRRLNAATKARPCTFKRILMKKVDHGPLVVSADSIELTQEPLRTGGEARSSLSPQFLQRREYHTPTAGTTFGTSGLGSSKSTTQYGVSQSITALPCPASARELNRSFDRWQLDAS